MSRCLQMCSCPDVQLASGPRFSSGFWIIDSLIMFHVSAGQDSDQLYSACTDVQHISRFLQMCSCADVPSWPLDYWLLIHVPCVCRTRFWFTILFCFIYSWCSICVSFHLNQIVSMSRCPADVQMSSHVSMSRCPAGRYGGVAGCYGGVTGGVWMY